MSSSMISAEYLINGKKMAHSRINNQLTRFKFDIDFHFLFVFVFFDRFKKSF